MVEISLFNFLSISFYKGGWKYRVNLGEDAGTNGWEHDFVGYVYPMPEEDGGTVPICVGYESDYWSNLVRQGECLEVKKNFFCLMTKSNDQLRL